MGTTASPTLKSVRVQNFKCLGDVTVDLEPLTVLIGKNDTGKTTFMEAVSRLATAQAVSGLTNALARSGSERRADQGQSELRKRGRADEEPTLVIGMGSDASQRQAVLLQGGAFAFDSKQKSAALSACFQFVQPAYRFDLAELRKPAVVGALGHDQPLPPNGRFFAAALDRMTHRLFDRLQMEVRDRLPLIEQIRRDPASDLQGAKVVAFDITGATRISAAQTSDGVMYVLAILTVLFDENAPKLIMFEEPETGIHPKQLETIVKAFIDITRKGTQIIVSTHSPYLLDFVPKESVRVFARGDDGEVSVRPLTASAQIRDMLSKGYTVGEAWYNSDENDIVTPDSYAHTRPQ